MVRSINRGINVRPIGSDPGAEWTRAINRAADVRYQAGTTLFRDDVGFTVLAHLPFRTESERVALDTLTLEALNVSVLWFAKFAPLFLVLFPLHRAQWYAGGDAARTRTSSL